MVAIAPWPEGRSRPYGAWPVAVKFGLWEAGNRCCYLCGQRLMMPKPRQGHDAMLPSVDHVTPLSHGGPDAIGNLAMAHCGCNNRKGDRMPTEAELAALAAINARLIVDGRPLVPR